MWLGKGREIIGPWKIPHYFYDDNNIACGAYLGKYRNKRGPHICFWGIYGKV